MPRGAKLTPEVEELIVNVCLEHLEWISKPKKIQQEVIRQLPDLLKVWGGPNWPGVDVINDRLRKKIRPNFENRPSESKRLDKPWSIAASLAYRISPEVSKDLFDIWRVSLALDRPISIRQARWIVHIRGLYYDSLTSYSDKVRRRLWLISQSWLYSIREQVSEIMGEEYFDTTALDAASFIPPWEYNTAVKLGKVPEVMFPQGQLTKLEESGTVLEGPPRGGFSVEQTVWQNVRTEPPPDMELMDIGLGEEPLPEEDDLISAYWLNYLSKGPKWKSLDYFEQRRIRLDLRTWVQQHSNMSIRDYYSKKGASPVINPKLSRQVGYEIAPEDDELWCSLHEKALKAEHDGWNALPADVQQRFIHDEQTDDDLTLLEDADNQSKVKREQREQEFIELVQHQGGVPVGKSRKERETFWKSIRDEWIKKYPEYAKSKFGYPQPEEFEYEYARLIKERNLNNKSSDSIKGGTP